MAFLLSDSVVVIVRYFGRAVAAATADTMEYQRTGWMDAGSNRIYAKPRVTDPKHPLCAVCEMDVDRRTAPKTVYHHATYLFCGEAHKTLFMNHPDRFANG